MNDDARPQTTPARPTLAQIALMGGLGPDQSFVATANRIMRWSIDAGGGARLDEAGVDRVDRLVAALIKVRDGNCADPQAVAREALT